MQNSSFVKYSVLKWETVNMARSAMSRIAHNLCQKFCLRQTMRSLFTSNRPTVRQQFDNSVICSTYNPRHLRSWDGGLKTVSLYQPLSLFLQVLMHVLTSSSVLAPSNVHKLVQMQNVSSTMHSNMQNAMTLAISVTTVEEWWNASSTDATANVVSLWWAPNTDTSYIC